MLLNNDTYIYLNYKYANSVIFLIIIYSLCILLIAIEAIRFLMQSRKKTNRVNIQPTPAVNEDFLDELDATVVLI